MLQELLLALSGHPSPLFDEDATKSSKVVSENPLAPAERALLASLSQDLGQKHRDIRQQAKKVANDHASVICRAVGASVLYKHLAEFQHKILDVERSILDQDSSIVGAYNIVPLSTIAAAFHGWDRKFEWLWTLVSRIITDKSREGPKGSRPHKLDTASRVIGFLRDATHTGYPDIEQLSLDLVQVAEAAWLKQLTPWLLYGKLSSIGATDFLVVQTSQDGGEESYSLRTNCVPPFVNAVTANSILFIGKSLDQIKSRKTSETARGDFLQGSTASILRSLLLHELEFLEFPINTSRFAGVVRSVRTSLSKNVLQDLLPLPTVLEVLQILRDYFLLGRGEFATALISAADDRMTEKQRTSSSRYAQKGSDGLSHLIIKEGEVSAILDRAWNSLSSFQTLDEDGDSDDSEHARKSIELSLESKVRQAMSSKLSEDLTGLPDVFQGFLVPTSTVLNLRLHSPVDLFLGAADVAVYSKMHAYLLAIRRAHLHLTRLYTLSGMRRGLKLAGDASSSKDPKQMGRQQAAIGRAKYMRPVWATISSAVFFLATLGEYLHSEVIQRSWDEIQRWLNPSALQSSRPSSRNNKNASISLNTSPYTERSQLSNTTTGHKSASQKQEASRDPETLTTAHRQFLKGLCHSLMLHEASFTKRLAALMQDIDHLTALMTRLDIVQQNVDLENTLDAASTKSGSEERQLLLDLASARRKVDGGISTLITLLQGIDAARATSMSVQMSTISGDDEFVPKVYNAMDRLLLKLDHATADTNVAVGEDDLG
ncbi:MAG: hypothetical protein Q9174_006397 [Haloplaca sp. 1 TL-2023]